MVSIKSYAIILILLTLPLAGCKSFMPPEYKTVKNFRVGKLGGNETTVKMDIVYHNPNKTAFRVKGTDLDIFIDDNFTGHTSLDTLILVPGNSDFILPVSITAKNTALFKNALAALFNQELLIKVSGTIKAGVGGLYKNFKIDYQGRQKIEFN
jgi:LEA14-like dessication related protein